MRKLYLTVHIAVAMICCLGCKSNYNAGINANVYNDKLHPQVKREVISAMRELGLIWPVILTPYGENMTDGTMFYLRDMHGKEVRVREVGDVLGHKVYVDIPVYDQENEINSHRIIYDSRLGHAVRQLASHQISHLDNAINYARLYLENGEIRKRVLSEYCLQISDLKDFLEGIRIMEYMETNERIYKEYKQLRQELDVLRKLHDEAETQAIQNDKIEYLSSSQYLNRLSKMQKNCHSKIVALQNTIYKNLGGVSENARQDKKDSNELKESEE